MTLGNMSDEEEIESSEEEEEESKVIVIEEREVEEEVKKTEIRPADESKREEAEFIKRQQSKEKRSDLDEQLKEYILEWRKQRAREEEELGKLKEKQAKRKTLRDQEEKRLAEKKREEDERRLRENEEKKQREQEEKLKRLEAAERKRQLMLQAQKASLSEKRLIGSRSYGGNDTVEIGSGGNRQELIKTKEQLEEEKKIAMSFRIKPLDFAGMNEDALRKKAAEIWAQIIRLETEKYDLEERQNRQDYDLKELKERQKQQLRHKALKRGLDPEALTGKYPPKLQVASKHERRVDTRSYEQKKNLFQGDLENLSKEVQEKAWAENIQMFEQRQKSKLPRWFGERPGKKKGAPDTPEDDDCKDLVNSDGILEPLNFGDEVENVETETKADAGVAEDDDEEDEDDDEEDE